MRKQCKMKRLTRMRKRCEKTEKDNIYTVAECMFQNKGIKLSEKETVEED